MKNALPALAHCGIALMPMAIVGIAVGKAEVAGEAETKAKMDARSARVVKEFIVIVMRN